MGLQNRVFLRGYLQPSVFGVFLILSLFYFLKRNMKGTFLALAIAAVFHANYIFIGGLMGLVYFLLFVPKRSN